MIANNWLLSLILSTAVLVFVLRRFGLPIKGSDPVCERCGYDMASSPGPICPECGGDTRVKLTWIEELHNSWIRDAITIAVGFAPSAMTLGLIFALSTFRYDHLIGTLAKPFLREPGVSLLMLIGLPVFIGLHGWLIVRILDSAHHKSSHLTVISMLFLLTANDHAAVHTSLIILSMKYG